MNWETILLFVLDDVFFLNIISPHKWLNCHLRTNWMLCHFWNLVSNWLCCPFWNIWCTRMPLPSWHLWLLRHLRNSCNWSLLFNENVVFMRLFLLLVHFYILLLWRLNHFIYNFKLLRLLLGSIATVVKLHRIICKFSHINLAILFFTTS